MLKEWVVFKLINLTTDYLNAYLDYFKEHENKDIVFTYDILKAAFMRIRQTDAYNHYSTRPL